MFTYEQINRRLKKARERREIWNQHFRECYRYTIPERQTFDEWSPGQKKRDWVFDSAPVEALEDYANRMESQVTPSWKNWAHLEAGTAIPEEEKVKVQEYLDTASELIFNNIKHSNFSSEVHPFYLDLGISTAAMIIEEGDGIKSAFKFRNVSLSEILLDPSENGRPETVYRDFKMRVDEILEIFPYATLTTDLNTMLKEKPESEVHLTESIIKVKDKQFQQILIYDKSQEFLYNQQREDSDWIVSRESVIPNESFGRGRVMRALPDIKSLNKMVEDHLRAAAFTATPMYTGIDDGILNPYTARIRPGIILPVGSNERGNPSLAPMPQAGNYQVLQYDIASLQDSIRKIMLSKPFGNIEQTPVRTALEMSIRNADMQQTTSASGGRLQTEFLEPLITKCYNILVKNGKLAGLKINGKEVSIKFTNPTARQQDTQDIATSLEYIQYVTTMLPEGVGMTSVKLEDFPKYWADKMGVPQKMLRTDEEKQKLAEKAAETMQLQQQGGEGGTL